MNIKYAVITNVPDPEKSGEDQKYPPSGNMCFTTDIWFDKNNQLDEPLKRASLDLMLMLRMQAFNVGEILILDDLGREIGYPGRKPSKWFIDWKEFSNIEEAIYLAQKIQQEMFKPTHQR